MKRHKDRPQNEWNVSLSLDMEPLVPTDAVWPIYIQVGDAVEEIKLGLGDMVLYPGHRYEHWREPQPSDHSLTVCICAFVGADSRGDPD